MLAGKMEDSMAANGRIEWDDVMRVVGGIGRARRTKRLPGWWTPELWVMRADVRRLPNSGQHDDYVLAWKVYPARMVDARDDSLGRQLADYNDPDIFRKIDKLELSRTLLTMDSGGCSYVTSHCGISDLVVGQLGPTSSCGNDNSLLYVHCPLPHVHEEEIVAGLALSPSDTSPGIDKVT